MGPSLFFVLFFQKLKDCKAKQTLLAKWEKMMWESSFLMGVIMDVSVCAIFSLNISQDVLRL